MRELAIPLALALVAIAGTQALATPRHMEPKLGRLAMVLIARVAVHEDTRPLRRSGTGTAGEPTEDHLAILQTALTFQAHFRYRSAVSAIRALAPHVTLRRAGSQQHRAYGTLPAQGRLRPAGWEDAKQGKWRVHGPLWARFRERMVQIGQEGFVPPCPGAPIAWGCTADYKKGCSDDKIARSRGLIPLACGERNKFWAKPATP